jgi:hypothetical protein
LSWWSASVGICWQRACPAPPGGGCFSAICCPRCQRLHSCWEAGLSFLGLGIRPPQHSLGYLIADGRETLSTAWWVVVFPGAALALLVLAAHLIGDGLRDLVQQDVEIIGR